MPFCCSLTNPPVLTADVLLSEGTNTIEFRYYNVSYDNSHAVDVGIENVAVNGVYDYISVINDITTTSTLAASLLGTSYVFTPVVPFTNPSVYGAALLSPPVVTSTSSVYGATQGSAPALLAFTPAGTLPYTDNGVTRVPIGFNFTFYNVSYPYTYVSANGNLQFQKAASDYYPYSFGTNSNADEVPFIAFFFSDLYPMAAPASRTYATLGTAPNRQFIVRYSQVPYGTYVGGVFSSLSCDVVLYETSNAIQFRYYSVGAQNAYYYVDIGIENSVYPATDYLSILSYVQLTPSLALSLVNVSYTITPLVPFTNPSYYPAPQAPVPSTTSPVYTAVGRTTPTAVAFTAQGTLPYTDNDVTIVPLGFSFVFYNVSYSYVLIGANGNLQFATGGTDSSPYTLGTSSNTNLSPFIAFFYTDLLPNAAPASRTYAVLGSAPNRQFIVRYSQVGLQTYISTDVLSCDVLLYESSNQIEFRYYQVPAFQVTYYYADIGLQGPGSVYDHIDIINYAAVTGLQAQALTNWSYIFTPITPFVNPPVFTVGLPLTPSSSSSYYTASVAAVPALASFTAAGALAYTDNEVSFVPLGFNFTYYNTTYSNAFVSANGNIQFATSSVASYPYSLGTSSNAALSPFIAFFFADLLPNAALPRVPTLLSALRPTASSSCATATWRCRAPSALKR